MMRHVFCAVAAIGCLLNFGPLAEAQQEPQAKVASPLLGNWIIQRIERGGEPQEVEENSTLTFSTTGVWLNDNEVGTYATDATTKPPLIDILVGGDDASQTVEGIYRIENDRLTLCVRVEDVKNRPASFETGEDGNLILVVLERKRD